MRKGLVILNFILLLSGLWFLNSVDARFSVNFLIANYTTKWEVAISTASNGSNFLVPVLNIAPNLFSLYARFINLNSSLGTELFIENSTFIIFDHKVAYGKLNLIV